MLRRTRPQGLWVIRNWVTPIKQVIRINSGTLYQEMPNQEMPNQEMPNQEMLT